MFTSPLKRRTLSDAICKSSLGMHEVDMNYDGYDEYAQTAEELIEEYKQQNPQVANENNRMPLALV